MGRNYRERQRQRQTDREREREKERERERKNRNRDKDRDGQVQAWDVWSEGDNSLPVEPRWGSILHFVQTLKEGHAWPRPDLFLLC